ncbi:hypothetical protein HMI55_005824 [Coelomomyces lativittatus]|nr:hypothetical protein HMI55_005824 [Coelomomyces lativittatus]
MMTFDNEDELYKIRKHHPNPLLVLRVLTDDSRSLCQFGVKFGANLSSSLSLLQLAKSLSLDVILEEAFQVLNRIPGSRFMPLQIALYLL